MSPPPDIYDFEGESGIWDGPMGPADPVNVSSCRLIAGAIGLAVAVAGVAIWSALPTLCRFAASMLEALL
ncbi:MAG: hypothetical protein V4461_11170 [Pseudomonadota bacterium]